MYRFWALLVLFALSLAACHPVPEADHTAGPTAPVAGTAEGLDSSTNTPPPPTPTASPTPAFPSQGRIVFYSGRDGDAEIYGMNPDGSGQVPLTDNDADDVAPVWSPDGTRIVFESDRDDPRPRLCFPRCNYNLYLMNADGSHQRRLTDLPGAEWHASWSPDGQSLVFTVGDIGSTTAGIYRMDIESGGMQPLLVDDFFNDGADWSPDGSRIAFNSDRDGDLDIYVMDADGSNVRQIADTGLDDYFPDWSPDGLRLTFFACRFPAIRQDIYVVNADGSGLVDLTHTPGIVDEDPLWVAGGSQILFQSDRDGNFEIYLMNADGSGARNLSQDPGPDYWPDWWTPPPATQIAFVTDRDRHTQVYLMNGDGSAQRPLLASNYDDYAPSWSPDGTQLAFYRHFSWQSWAIMLSDADGGNLRQLTGEADGLTCSFGPLWSPDGTQIAFIVEPDPRPTCEIKHTEIAVMDADGGTVRLLTANDSNELVAGWSPDMTRIYFTSDRDGEYQIYVMDADGANPQRLTELTSINSMPSLSPDGRFIAFVSDRDGNDEIYVMDADGAHPTRLTEDPASDWQPSWSPDGRQIIFTSGTMNGGFDLFVMNADGSGRQQLTRDPGWDFEPAWRPRP